MKTLATWVWWSLGAALVLLALLCVAILEYVWTAYVPLWVFAGVILGCYAMLFAWTSRERGLTPWILPALFTLGLLWVFSDSQNSSQSLMRDLHRVKQGMNIAQVEAIMGQYNRYNALFDIQNTRRLPSGQLELVAPEYAVYKHSTPDDGFYNAAHGLVRFKDGKVTSVEYVGD